MKNIINWFKELFKLIDEQCPACGYYCLGKYIDCAK